MEAQPGGRPRISEACNRVANGIAWQVYREGVREFRRGELVVCSAVLIVAFSVWLVINLQGGGF